MTIMIFFLHASFKCLLVIEKTTKKTEMNEKINKSSYKACDKNDILCNEKKIINVLSDIKSCDNQGLCIMLVI